MMWHIILDTQGLSSSEQKQELWDGGSEWLPARSDDKIRELKCTFCFSFRPAQLSSRPVCCSSQLRMAPPVCWRSSGKLPGSPPETHFSMCFFILIISLKLTGLQRAAGGGRGAEEEETGWEADPAGGGGAEEEQRSGFGTTRHKRGLGDRQVASWHTLTWRAATWRESFSYKTGRPLHSKSPETSRYLSESCFTGLLLWSNHVFERVVKLRPSSAFQSWSIVTNHPVTFGIFLSQSSVAPMPTGLKQIIRILTKGQT